MTLFVHKLLPFFSKSGNDEINKPDGYNYIYNVPNGASESKLKERLKQKCKSSKNKTQAIFLGFKIIVGEIGERKGRCETN